jgi:hypothetical protein
MAAENETLDKILAAVVGLNSTVTSLNSRMDAMESAAEKDRKDAEEKERADKARKDAAEAEEKKRADKGRRDAARKDRFGARKDGESDEEFGKRCDADEEAERKDWEEEGEKEEAAKDKARSRRDACMAADKARKDAFEKEEKEREDKARKDAAAAGDADLKAQLAAMQATLAGLATERAPEEANAISAAQARADAIAAQFGDKVPPPIAGETSLAYRRRLVKRFQAHSPRFKDEKLDGLAAGPLSAIEDIVYADAQAAARDPKTGPGVGRLIPHKSIDSAGRTITEFSGDPMAWMGQFMTSGRNGKFNRENAQRH